MGERNRACAMTPLTAEEKARLRELWRTPQLTWAELREQCDLTFRLLDAYEALEHYEVEYRSASRALDELGIGVGGGFPLSRRIQELARSRGREGA